VDDVEQQVGILVSHPPPPERRRRPGSCQRMCRERCSPSPSQRNAGPLPESLRRAGRGGE
jgi:hypothetical protein